LRYYKADTSQFMEYELFTMALQSTIKAGCKKKEKKRKKGLLCTKATKYSYDQIKVHHSYI